MGAGAGAGAMPHWPCLSLPQPSICPCRSTALPRMQHGPWGQLGPSLCSAAGGQEPGQPFWEGAAMAVPRLPGRAPAPFWPLPEALGGRQLCGAGCLEGLCPVLLQQGGMRVSSQTPLVTGLPSPRPCLLFLGDEKKHSSLGVLWQRAALSRCSLPALFPPRRTDLLSGGPGLARGICSPSKPQPAA